MVVATEKARKQAEQAQKDYKQYKKQLGGLENTLSDLKTQLANHEPGVTKQDILELQGIIADTKDDEAWYVSNVALAGANLASKITLLAKQTAAAAQSSGTYGFDVGLEANVNASTSKNETISSTAQGSTIAGNNINIKAGQDATIQGSQVLADDELNLSAENINILASKDTQYTQSSSESGSITVSTSVYGASTGLSVNAEMSNSAVTSNSTTYNNSVLVGDNVTMNSSNDTTIKGGNVIANNTLNVDVGGDLTVESVQNRETANNHGMSISAGTSFGGGAADSNWHAPEGGDLSGGSAGFNQSQGRSSQTDTVISSLVSNGDANINVKGNTDLTGSTIATLDENSNDSGKLAMNTGSLTFTDLSDTRYSSNNNNGVNTSVGINGTDIDATNNSTTLNLANGSHYSKDKTLATLGQGEITVNGQTETGDGTVLAPELNRDIHNQDKELFAVDRQQGNVDVTVDHRLLTEEGREQVVKDLDEFGQNTQIMANDVASIPKIKCDQECSSVESNYNKAVEVLSLLDIPTEYNNGGIIAQVPVLFGGDDIKHTITGDKNSDVYTVNGILNTFEGAQEGGNIMAGEGVAHQTVYNPTHGIFSDLLESAVDLVGNHVGIQTGISQQMEQFQKDCVGCMIYMHSQANIISQAGANPENGNQYISIGSPLWNSTLKDKFNINNKSYILKHDGDYVAKPINVINPTTWNNAGHPVEAYKPELNKLHEGLYDRK
nr:hemagglutinin repeat-containing protein [Vibrio sp. S17_S38]